MALDLYLFGDKLRRYREQLELSLDEVSHATGIGEVALAAFEKGERSPRSFYIKPLTPPVVSSRVLPLWLMNAS
jgi:predicted transcriptional regulator